MSSNKPSPPPVTLDEFLKLCQEDISLEEYYEFEKKRVKQSNKINASIWIDIIKGQKMKCYYCETDLRIIQQLILEKIINPRKRGRYGFSGLHFELDHKNFDTIDNSRTNLVASCYYCNNDRSNLISDDIFKKYFGVHKKTSFKKLFEDSELKKRDTYRHHLKGKKQK